MSKANIKHDVIRPQFCHSIRAIRKTAKESKSNCVPRLEIDDPEQTLDNVRYVIEDTNIRLHGWNNMHRHIGGPGYHYEEVKGDVLASYLLTSVKNAFEYPRVHTFVMNMDKGLFMPPPKIFTQKNRTDAIIKTMEKKNIAPLQFNADGSVPVMIATDVVIPRWDAVCANRTFFRHATYQLIMLIAKTYKPPPGRRLIIDALDMNASSPATLADWMRSETIEMDDFARDKVERTRAALQKLDDGTVNNHYDDTSNNWRMQTMLVAKELAQAGHLKSIPFCIETDEHGTTYPPFLLRGATNNCGEADVGILRWIEMMQADRQHVTLRGERTKAVSIDPSLHAFYSAEHLAAVDVLRKQIVADPLSMRERVANAKKAIEMNPDLLLPGKLDVDSTRARIAEGMPLLPTNPCREPNRAMVLSVDTDFLSLLPVFYARMCFEKGPENTQYCRDNAPLLSLGEARVMRLGWLETAADFFKAPPKRKRGGDDDEDDGGEVSDDEQAVDAAIVSANEALAILAHEVYDIHRMYEQLVAIAETTHESLQQRLESVLSFALFCAACKNDYMKGNYGINRKHQFEAFIALKCRLVIYHVDLDLPVLVPSQYQAYAKHCYYVSVRAKKGGEKWLPRPATSMTSDEMRAVTIKKYKGTGERSVSSRMPDNERRELMIERLQWWLVYAYCSWQDIGPILDHNAWGWNPATTHLMV